MTWCSWTRAATAPCEFRPASFASNAPAQFKRHTLTAPGGPCRTGAAAAAAAASLPLCVPPVPSSLSSMSCRFLSLSTNGRSKELHRSNQLKMYNSRGLQATASGSMQSRGASAGAPLALPFTHVNVCSYTDVGAATAASWPHCRSPQPVQDGPALRENNKQQQQPLFLAAAACQGGGDGAHRGHPGRPPGALCLRLAQGGPGRIGWARSEGWGAAQRAALCEPRDGSLACGAAPLGSPS